MTSRFLPIFRRGYEPGARRRAGAGLLLLAMSTAPGFAATPRLLPDRDASAIYPGFAVMRQMRLLATSVSN